MLFFGRRSKSKKAASLPLPSRFKPRLESLEDRFNPATYDFVGGAAGAVNSWSAVANWTSNGAAAAVLPGAADDVTIGANKTANFDVGANVTIKSLTMGSGARFDLGKATAAGLTLTVNGGNSTLGPVAAIGNTATIVSATQNGNNANILFSGNGSVAINKFTATMASTGVGGGLANLAKFQLNTKTVTVTREATLSADTIVGDGNFGVIMTINNGTEFFTCGRWGNFTINNKASVIIKGGGGWTKDAQNNSPIVNNGKLILDVGNGNSYKVSPPLQGGKILGMSGKLGAVFPGTHQTNVIMWSGAELDSSDGTSTLGVMDQINFVSDGDVTGVKLYGAFTFSNGAMENFHAFTLPKPNLATIDTWVYGSFTTTPISFAVNLLADSNGVQSWAGTNDNMSFDVNVGSTIDHVTLNIGSATFTESGGILQIRTTGSTPSPGTTVPLFVASGSFTHFFGTYSFTGYTWGLWSPGSSTFGLIS